MKFTTQQLRSYALTVWEFQSLESAKSFCESLVDFLDLMPAPKPNQLLRTLRLNAVYHFRVCNTESRFDQALSEIYSKMVETSFCLETR